MKTCFNVLAIISVQVALALLDIGSILAAPTLASNSDGPLSIQRNINAGVPTPPVEASVNPLFRDVPSLSARYSVGGMTVLPYIGAGFRGGYASEFDRALVPNLQPQQNLNIGGQLGQSIVPNEFKLGIRIPF